LVIKVNGKKITLLGFTKMSISESRSPGNVDPGKINILIVDDEKTIQDMLGHLLEINGYSCRTASDAGEARSIMKEHDFELVLCDVNMPGESGIDLIKYLCGAYSGTAVIMVTAEDDKELAETALDMGAYGYVIKPFKANELMINISNALRRRNLEISNRMHMENLESIIDERTAELQNTLEKLNKSTEGIIRAVSSTVEIRDPYTAGHQQRVADLAQAIAKEMRLPEEQIQGIGMAGLIHDLGKIAVPAEILTKPGKLSEIEFALIKLHPQAGYDIIKEIEFPWPIARIVVEHHERINGSGYPNGLSGEEMLQESRILAVADVVEAMASHRPYRAALGLDIALEEISKNKGILYDPESADACIKIISKGRFRFNTS
jgi:putative two-component system response regulator